MKHLFTDLFYSIAEPKFYRVIIGKSVTHSMGYFLFYFTIFILTFGLYVTLVIAPSAIQQASAMLQDFSAGFPQATTVTVQNNYLSLVGTDPITIPLNQNLQISADNLLIINPSANAGSIKDANTLILMTEDEFSFLSDPNSGQYQVIPWSQLDLDFTLDNPTAQHISSSGQESLNNLKPFTFPLTVILGIVILIPSRLAFVAIYTILFNIAGNLSQRNYGYRSYFIIGLHTVVIAQIIDLLQRLIYPNPWPMLFSIAYVGITTIALISLRPIPKMLIKA